MTVGLAWTGEQSIGGALRETVAPFDIVTPSDNACIGNGAGISVSARLGERIDRWTVSRMARKLTFGDINGGLNYVADESAKQVWGRWNADRTAKVHSFGAVNFSDVTDPARLLALTRRALAEAVQPKVSYEVDVAALDADDAGLGDTVAVIDTSRNPEWRLKARIVCRVRTFGDSVVARVTIGTVQPVDYASVSSLAADVAALQSDVTGIDGNLTTAASVAVAENTVTTAIDDLDELAEVEF